MAFIKVGDETPIKAFYTDDMEVAKCPKCGELLTAVALDSDVNEPVCPCDLEDAE